MTPLSEAFLAELRRHPAAWVSNDELAQALYDRQECCATTCDRIRHAVRQLRSELPAGLLIESGVRLGYRLVGARVVE